MNSTEKKDLKIELKSRRLIVKKLETAIRALSGTADRNKIVRQIQRDKLLEYKTYNEAQDAYGWGIITEEEFDEITNFLESSQEIVDKPSAEEIAVNILVGWKKIMQSDIADLEFQLLPEKEQERIREENYRIAMERKERMKQRNEADSI